MNANIHSEPGGITRITSLSHPGVELFASLTEAQLRQRVEGECGVFIAESPKVITTALNAGYEPVALLAEERHLRGDAAPLLERLGSDVKVYCGERELLRELTGYTLTRGVLCAMKRPQLAPVEALLQDARRVAVIDGVSDTTNIGSIFRSAAALGIDAVLLTPTACDPLCRRSIRVSMGSVFLVPWTRLEVPLSQRPLAPLGFVTAALALKDRSISLADPALHCTERLALLLGTEGDGLADEVIDAADMVVRIPMSHGVDSLNVGAAAAVAFWELRVRG